MRINFPYQNLRCPEIFSLKLMKPKICLNTAYIYLHPKHRMDYAFVLKAIELGK
jgi:hypothetical protein